VSAVTVYVPRWRTASGSRQACTPQRPFGTQREQAALQQQWLQKRLDTFLPGLMRQYGIDMWVVPMREYNEDPIFKAIVAPETFAARRRTIYVFFDRCAAKAAPPAADCIERIALGGTSQGGVFEARRAAVEAAGDVGRASRPSSGATLSGSCSRRSSRSATPVIGINRSTVFALLRRPHERRVLEGMSKPRSASVDVAVPRTPRRCRWT
jgi:hypothetical protein